MAKIACQDCVEAGCSFESCGLSSKSCGGQTPDCVGCAASFHRCTLDACDCLQQLHECARTAGCAVHEADDVANTNMCIFHGCWDEKYSYCAELVGVPTEVTCSQSFLECQDTAMLPQPELPGKNELQCVCAEQWYHCLTECVDLDNSTSSITMPLHGVCALLAEVYVSRGAEEAHRQCQHYHDTVAIPGNLARGPFDLCCVCGGGRGGGVYRHSLVKRANAARTLSKQHFDMCSASGCAHVCGENPWHTCDEIAASCGAALMQCRANATRLHARNDSCSLLYQGGGLAFCSDRAFGGLEGCFYDEVADICHTHEECVCISEYHRCATANGCEDSKWDENVELCSSLACSAAQCGLGEPTCNETSLACANQYLNCALRGTPSVDEMQNECFGQCLRAYYMCMTRASCMNSLDHHQHSTLCEASGCSIAECGLTLEPEVQFLPDAPGRVLLMSLPGNSIRMSWENSSLAEQWLNMGSINTLLEYHVVLKACADDDAEQPQSTAADMQTLRCSSVVKSMASGFFGRAQVVVEELAVGTTYQISVTARNLAGSGPALTYRHKLLGPPSPPTNLTISVLGALQLEITWTLPDSVGVGDSSQSFVPIEGFELLALASDGVGAAIKCGLGGRYMPDGRGS